MTKFSIGGGEAVLFGGWRKHLNQDLNGLGLIEAIDYMGVSSEAGEPSEEAIVKVLLEMGPFPLPDETKQDELDSRLDELAQELGNANVQTAWAAREFPYLGRFVQAQLSLPMRSDTDFVRYFFGTFLKEAGDNTLLLFALLFPLVDGTKAETFGISARHRKLLIETLVDRVASKAKLKKMFEEFVDEHPHYRNYPRILTRSLELEAKARQRG